MNKAYANPKTILVTLTSLFIALPVFAMSSANYSIYSDSISVGGGGYASSTGYQLQDTIGEAVVNISTSTSYVERGGYQQAELGVLSVTVNPRSISLGSFGAGHVVSTSTKVTISTSANTGYVLSMENVNGSMIQAVTDGEVTTSSEEYGVSGSGNDNLLVGDVGVQDGLLVAAASGPTTDSVIDLVFKASASETTVAQHYQQDITFTVSSNF